MRVTLDLVLHCPPDAAWEAVHSPAVFRAVSSPWTAVESLEAGGFPERWPGGDHRVRLRMLGVLPLGTQLIRLSDEVTPGVRTVHDTGGPLTGPMRIVRMWHHRMAISAEPGGARAVSGSETASGAAERTRFRDTLTVKAGPLTPLVWLGFTVFWRLRGRALKRLAPEWKA